MLKLFYAFLKISFVLSNHTSWLIFLSSAATLDKEICAGALISEHWIITAAQCLYDRSAEKIIAYNNRKDQYRLIAQYFIHEAYDHESKVNDIALLKPVLPFSVDENTQPVCITNQIDKLICGKGGCERKLQVSFPKGLFLLKEEACREYYKNTPIVQRITDRIYCLFGTVKQPKNSRKCKTLAGYPFTYDNELGETVLTGIISHGWTCSMSSFPTIVTKISSYYKWVMDITLAGSSSSSIFCSYDRRYLKDISDVYKSLMSKASMMRNVGQEQNVQISNGNNEENRNNYIRNNFVPRLESFATGNENDVEHLQKYDDDEKLTDILSYLKSYFPLLILEKSSTSPPKMQTNLWTKLTTLAPVIQKNLSTKSTFSPETKGNMSGSFSALEDMKARIPRQKGPGTVETFFPYDMLHDDAVIHTQPVMEEKRNMIKPEKVQEHDYVLVDYPQFLQEFQTQPTSTLEAPHFATITPPTPSTPSLQQTMVTPTLMPTAPVKPPTVQISSTQLPIFPLSSKPIPGGKLDTESNNINCKNGFGLGCTQGNLTTESKKKLLLLSFLVSIVI